MLIEDLMEKPERGSYSIILTLLYANQATTIKEVMEETGLSRSTILKYIELINSLPPINQLEKMELSIDLQEDALQLSLGLAITQKEIAYYFLSQSPKYQIIDYIFQHQQFTIQELADNLLMSDASLHRHLAGLNSLLEEFQLVIKSGKLRGPEHQIRYFYYLFFQECLPSRLFKPLLEDSAIEQQIVQISRIFQCEFSEDELLKIVTWLHITKRRFPRSRKNFSSLETLMRPYQDHRIYQLVRQTTFRFFSRYAVEMDEGEAMCQFLFFKVMSVLPIVTMEHSLGYGGPIMDATTMGLQAIKLLDPSQDNLNEIAMYELSQITGKLYFFTGHLRSLASALEEEKSSVESNETCIGLSTQLLDGIFKDTYTNRSLYDLGDLYDLSHKEIYKVFTYILEREPKLLVVGVDLIGSVIDKKRNLQKLRASLEKNRFIVLEPFEEEVSYSLIISNQGQDRFQDTKALVYQLKSSQVMDFDIEQLRNLMEEVLATN